MSASLANLAGRLLLPTILALSLASCGGGHAKPPHRPVPPTVKAACPKASDGQHGAMGVCAPKAIKSQLAGSPLPLLMPLRPTSGGQQVADLSNNDPCPGLDCRYLRSNYSGLIVKANQGEGFRDRTMVGMVASARGAGLTVGAYDFDQDYTVGEAAVFVDQMHQAGLYGNSRNTFPAYLDVEYGNFSYSGLVAQVNYLRSQGYRVGIYTGEWYYAPHAGCRFPIGLLSLWLSGYPNAPVPCGAYAYNLHQFTDSPFDRSVFIGNDYAGFVNAGPPPDPYLIFPKTKFRFGHFAFDEYTAVKSYDQLKCSHPLRRDACKRSEQEIRLLQTRLLFVAYHHFSHGHWVSTHPPDFKTARRGTRNRLEGLRLVNRYPRHL